MIDDKDKTGMYVCSDWKKFLSPDGLVGDTAKWIGQSSGMEQPKFALAAALTVCGSLLSRIVKDQDGQHTNLYTLAIGNSSAGKNDPIRAIRSMLFSLNRERLLAGEVTSDSALEILLDDFPARLLLLDEIGHYVANVKTAGPSNGYLRTVMPMLTKAWSAASGALEGKTRANDSNGKWHPPKLIHAPCVCLYGTTVPGVLFDSMGFEDFADGSIPRFVSFVSTTRPTFKPKGEIILSDQLRSRMMERLEKLGANPAVYERHDKDAPKPMWNTPKMFTRTREAEAIFSEFEREKTNYLIAADAGDPPLYLYGKAVENAKRIALIVAALKNNTRNQITGYDANYAVDLMRQTIAEMVDHVRLNVANSKEERDAKTLERIVRRAGEHGISQSEITRATQGMRRRDRDDIIEDLVEAGTVVRTEVKGRGDKKITMYFYAG